MRRRWPAALIATLLLVLLGGFVATILTSRRIEGTVPGRAPVLGLAALDDGFLVGTGRGVLSSRDGKTWALVDRFGRGASLIADGREQAWVLSGGAVEVTQDLDAFEEIYRPARGVAVAAAGGGFYAVQDPKRLLVIRGGQPTEMVVAPGPREIVAFAVRDDDPESFLAGGLTSGLWRSEDGGRSWTRILETPVRAILHHPAGMGRIFIGTGGGILYSDDGLRWRFTDLRLRVEALAEAGGTLFALTGDRLLYESSDGMSWRLVLDEGRRGASST
ncbi:MAG: hypothetical protein M3164_06940 [Actinomycetota bacterium]|nr:hypothetical protein [Actinomycetota bacterium]